MKGPLTRISIFSKALVAPVAILTMFALQGGVSLRLGTVLDREFTHIGTDLMPEAALAVDLLQELFQQRLAMKSYLQTGDESFADAFRVQENASRELLAKAGREIVAEQPRAQLDAIAALHRDYSSTFEDTIVPIMRQRAAEIDNVLDVQGGQIDRALTDIMAATRRGGADAVYLAGSLRAQWLGTRADVLSYLAGDDPRARQRAQQGLVGVRESLSDLPDALQESQIRASVARAVAALDAYQTSFAALQRAMDARDAAIARMDRIGPDIATKAGDLRNDALGAVSTTVERAHQQLREGAWVTLATLAIALLAGALIAFLVGRVIAAPLRRTSVLLHDIANGGGDLRVRLPAEGRDELTALAGGFNLFVEKLQGVIAPVQSSVTQLATAAEELSAVTQDNRRTLACQAEETDQVAAAVTEMSATLQEVARNVNYMAESATAIKGEATQSRAVEAQALTSIQQLGDDIREIADIVAEAGRASDTVTQVVDVINSLAEQTNLLALNAAIEAARAGDQGRGFAVVADEVRALAALTRTSTGDIQQTVDRLRGSVSRAVESMARGCERADSVIGQARQVDAALADITAGIVRMEEMTAQIAAATEQQSAVSYEINRNVVNLRDQAAQSNSAIEQVGAAAAELARLSADLETRVGYFVAAE